MKNLNLFLALIFTAILFSACGDDDGADNLQQEEEASSTTTTTGGITTGGATVGGTTTGGMVVGGTDGGNPSKTVFSSWRRSDGANLDLRGRTFNRPDSFIIFTDLGSTCRCFLTVSGSENSGSFNLTSCKWNADGPGDPGCTEQSGSTFYSKTGNFLHLNCNANNRPAPCGNYN